MASKKQYKNVYTILEKVKKGEIDTYYKEKDGLFGKIDFYKRPDLIKPHMHYLDETRLERIVDTFIRQGGDKSAEDFYKKLSSYSKFKILPEDKKPDYQTFSRKIQETYSKFPKHIMRDVFKMYYHKMPQLEFEDRTDKTQTKFKFLEKANNPVGKIMTETSSLKSSIYTRSIMMYYMMQMTAMEYIDPNQAKDMMNGLNGNNSDFDQKDLDKALDDMFNNKLGKDQLEQAMQEAQKMCQQMDQNIPDSIQDKMFDEANQGGGQGASKISPDYMRKIAESLQNVSMSMGSLKEKIKRLLDKTTSYFSSRQVVKYDDLFNSDNVAGLDDFVFLHPKLRKFMIEDVMIKDVKHVGKIDIYIDVSGSMSSGCGVSDTKGSSISKLDFSKSFTAKLLEMDMLNNVYLFDTRVKKISTDMVSIAMIDCGGGTTIDNAVRSIENGGNNAIVITDAEDSCNTYSSKAFFIGVNGARFHHFNSNTIAQYSQKGQAVVFDGKKIHPVDQNGYCKK